MADDDLDSFLARIERSHRKLVESRRQKALSLKSIELMEIEERVKYHRALKHKPRSTALPLIKASAYSKKLLRWIK